MATSQTEYWNFLTNKLVRQLENGLFNFTEFANALTNVIISAPDPWMPECVAAIPAPLSRPFWEHLVAVLEPVDYMPCPGIFMVGPRFEDAVNAKKKELRVKYLNLVALVKARLESACVRS